MYKKVNRVLVGDGANNGAASLPGIVKGDLLLVTADGTVLTTYTAAAAVAKFKEVYIALGIADGEAVFSSPIQGNTVSKYEGHNYVAPVESVVVVGPDLGAVNGTQYHLRIFIKDQNRIFGEKPTIIDFFSTATGSQSALALDFMKQFYTTDYGVNFQQSLLTLNRKTNGTGPTAFGTGVDLTVTKGSTTVLTAADATTTAGDVVRLGGFDYIVAVDNGAASFTIDTPYTGATQTIAVAAQAAAGFGTIASATTWGLVLTGVPQSSRVSRSANEPIDEYEWVIFDASYSATDLSFTGSVVKTVEAQPGNGYWKQVAQAEQFAKGYLGDTSRRRYYDIRIDNNTVVGTPYASVVITHEAIFNGDFQEKTSGPLMTEIFIPVTTPGSTPSSQGTAGTGSTATFLAILNGFFSGSVGFSAIASLV